jgi:hypothetical protein
MGVMRLFNKYVDRDPGYAPGGAKEAKKETKETKGTTRVAEPGRATAPGREGEARIVRARIGKSVVIRSPGETLRFFLDRQLSFRNPRYEMQIKYRGDAGGMSPSLNLVRYKDGDAYAPRGFLSRLIDWCHEHRVKFEYVDECRKWPSRNPMGLKVRLDADQERALGAIGTRRYGILTGAPGSGRKLVALARACGRQERTLVLVKTKRQMYAWDAFLKKSAEADIGFLGDGKKDSGADVLVATDRSFYANADDEEVAGRGVVIVDRVDEVNPKVLITGLGSVDCGVSIGLACGKSRKDGLTGLMLAAAGPVIGELPKRGVYAGGLSAVVMDSGTSVSNGLDWAGIKRRIVGDEQRNFKIAEDLCAFARAGKKALVVSREKKHLEEIKKHLKRLDKESSYINSSTGARARKTEIDRFRYGAVSVLFAPFKSVSGLAELSFDYVFVVYPVRIESRVGYLLAGLLGKNGVVMEYRDGNKKLAGSLSGRLKLYREMGIDVAEV